MTQLKTQTGFNAIRQRAGAFRDDIRGNVGLMLAVTAFPLLICVGVGVDYTQIVSDHQKAQDAVDAAVLGAAKEYYSDFAREDAVTAAEVSARYNLDDEPRADGYVLTTEVTETSSTTLQIKSTIEGTSKNAFLGIIGHRTTDWTVVAYSEVEIPKVEIMLVMDASYSMRGQKIVNLRSALVNFVETVDPYSVGDSHISITLLPFGENLNFGQDAIPWLDPSFGPYNTTNFNGCFIFDDLDSAGSITPAVLGGNVQGIPYCPPAGAEVEMFSTDAAAITSKVQDLELGYGTQTTRGLVWAERFLNNGWRNNARSITNNTPVQLTNDTKKIVILLTDGEIVARDSDQDGLDDRRGVINRNRQSSRVEFTRQCETMDQIPNLDLYAVAYDLGNGVFKNILEDCVSGNGQYFDADVGDLDAVFTEIIANLTPVRISG